MSWGSGGEDRGRGQGRDGSGGGWGGRRGAGVWICLVEPDVGIGLAEVSCWDGVAEAGFGDWARRGLMSGLIR